MDGINIRFPLLTTERYLNAVEAAKDQIRKRIEPPKMEDLRAESVSAYPAWFTRGIIVALLLVLLFSFVISAGKQAAAMGLVMDHLPSRFNHLSSGWADLSIIFMLLMSEVGAVLFLVASGTLAAKVHATPLYRRTKKDGTVRVYELNITQLIFRLFAVLCAAYAILSNVTITVLDPLAGIAGFLQWMVSVGIPLTVLGLGIMLERIVIDSLRSDTEMQMQHAVKMREYQNAVSDPTQHEYFKRALFDALYQEIIRYKAERDKLGSFMTVVETEQDAKKWLVLQEYSAHKSMAEFDIESGGTVNPFLPAVATQ
jgi:hypothetical protein